MALRLPRLCLAVLSVIARNLTTTTLLTTNAHNLSLLLGEPAQSKLVMELQLSEQC